MKLIDNFEKDCEIYRNGDEAEDVYFVKEGIVLLERVGKIQSEVVQEY
jgi:CRP-like cAMP-binding protein